MGCDDENLEPKPRKTFKAKQNDSKTFCVVFNDNKYEISATSTENFYESVKEKLGIKENAKIKAEYWSDKYQEWIIMQSLPESSSKLKISLDNQ